MSFFSDTLLDTITVASQTGVDENGEPSYGAQTTRRARVQQARDRDETEIAHTAVVYLDEAVAVTDRIWLPGENVADPNAARVPKSVQPTRGLDGRDPIWKVLI